MMILTAALSCSKKPDNETTGTDVPGGKEDNKEYTLRVGLANACDDWNVHNGVTPYTELIAPGFVAAVANAEGGFTWMFDAADGITDATLSLGEEQRSRWNVAAGETGRFWRITLNGALAWQDGAKISASDYVGSMEKLLEPGTEKAAASRYISGGAALFGAREFHSGIKAGDSIYLPYIIGYTEEGEQIADPAASGEELYFNSSSKVFFFNDTFDAYYRKYSGKAAFAAMSDYVGKGSVEAGDGLKELLNDVAAEFGETSPDAWKEFCVFKSGTASASASFSGVGLFAEDDRTLVYVTEESVSEYEFYKLMMLSWLVRDDLYGDVYCTSPEKTCSFGPYKMTGPGRFEKNDKWFGNADGRHGGQYAATAVLFEALPEDSGTDGSLRGFGVAERGGNGAKLYAEKPVTERLILVTDRDALKNMSEADGANRILLSYTDFRRALSLCIDRTDLAEKLKFGKPASALFGYSYFYDIENDTKSVYRLTEEGIKAAGALTTGMTDAEQRAEAKKLFSAAYEAALAAGDVAESDVFTFRVAVGEEFGGVTTALENAINGYISAAVADTALEGKITFVFAVRGDRYTAVENGEIEAAIGAWQSPFDDVFSAVRLYTDNDYAAPINETRGFDPSAETVVVTAKFDGNTETTLEKSYTEWSRSINRGGEYYGSPVGVKLAVLSALETGLLSDARSIPLLFDADIGIYDPEVCTVGGELYNEISGFGGVRTVGFLRSDAGNE